MAGDQPSNDLKTRATAIEHEAAKVLGDQAHKLDERNFRQVEVDYSLLSSDLAAASKQKYFLQLLQQLERDKSIVLTNVSYRGKNIDLDFILPTQPHNNDNAMICKEKLTITPKHGVTSRSNCGFDASDVSAAKPF